VLAGHARLKAAGLESTYKELKLAKKAGYAKESGVAGEYKKIVVIFR